MFGLRRDRAVPDAVQDAPGDRRVRLAEAVVGLGQAVASPSAPTWASMQLLDDPAGGP